MVSKGPSLSSLAVEKVQNPALPLVSAVHWGIFPSRLPGSPTQQLCPVGIWSEHLDVCTDVACGADG